MIQIKSPREIEIMARGGEILAATVRLLEKSVRPGMATIELDTMAQVNQHLLLRKYDGFMKKGRVRFRGRQAGGTY